MKKLLIILLLLGMMGCSACVNIDEIGHSDWEELDDCPANDWEDGEE